jgi:SOS-response transcriptional repressor LexA
MSLPPLHRYIGRIIHLMRKEKGMRQSELALLTGLKQPNLSRIENGLVSPRQATLEKIAKALGVEVQVFFSESKVQEVERKWAASMGPKHAALLLSGKLVPVPLLDGTEGKMPPQQNKQELMLQLPPDRGLEEHHPFAMRISGDSMHKEGAADDFKPGEIAIFSNDEVKSGDFALVELPESNIFRRVIYLDNNRVRLVPLNEHYPERMAQRAEIKQMWKLMRHVRDYAGAS